MKISKICIVSCIIIAALFTACKKKDNNSNSSGPNTNQPVEEVGFFYAENGNATLTKAHTSVSYIQHKTIIAQNDGKTVVEFVLTNLNVGKHDLSPKYAFTYVKDNQHWEATKGTLEITKNDGKLISGTFSADAGSGATGVNSVHGKFIDVELK